MKKLIIINGTAYSGKDTFVKYVKDYNDNIKNFSSVDLIRLIMKKYLGWDGESKTDDDRLFLSEFKKLWISYNDGPLNHLKQYVELHRDSIIFIHIREPEEIQKVKDFYGDECMTLLVKRGGLDIPANSSDLSVFEYDYDMTIYNDGTFDELSEQAKKFNEDYL